MKNKIGSISNFIAALIFLVFGVIYLVKGSFMSYHHKAVLQNWEELSQNLQTLILALMRTVSGGFIIASVATVWLQVTYNKTSLRSLPNLIFLSGMVITAITFYATIMVRLNTPGNPPYFIALINMLLLSTGLYFNLKAKRVVSS